MTAHLDQLLKREALCRDRVVGAPGRRTSSGVEPCAIPLRRRNLSPNWFRLHLDGLCAGAKRGRMSKDEDFADFVSSRWLPIVRAGIALGCSLSDAEDLAQSTFMRAYVAWAKVSDADRPDAYVSKMLINAHRDMHRKRWRKELLLAELPEHAGEDESVASDSAEALRRAMSRLSQGQREVVALRYFVRLPESEIAATLRIAPGTVKSRLSRALDALSVSPDLAEYGGTP